MKAILLDGSQKNDITGERVCSVLSQELQARGWEVNHILLRELTIGNCAGDFFCWIRTPGVCNVNDDNRRIAELLVGSDLMVYLTPVTFGGYSSTLKRMVDHQIQNISPFFTKIDGETHHQKRYARYPNFLAIGWMQQADPPSEEVFRRLCQRNALNFYSNKSVSGVIFGNQLEDEILEAVRGWLSELQDSPPRKDERNSAKIFEHSEVLIREPHSVRRALLLVGSPRTRKSTSNSLGGYVLEQLKAQSIQTETIYVHTVLRSPEKLNNLMSAIDNADLILLAFPLYVDSLPAPVIEALEHIKAHRHDFVSERPVLFAAIANCGFPEASHCAVALDICELFARQSNFVWAGSLALGAGEGIVHGEALDTAGGPSVLLKQALNMAAKSLSRGEDIPLEATALLAKPIIPSWLYRFMGGFGWGQQAKKYGVEKQLRRKAYMQSK